MTTTMWAAVARHCLTGLGTWLTAAGLADDATVQTAIGGIMAVAPLVWSLVEKKRAA